MTGSAWRSCLFEDASKVWTSIARQLHSLVRKVKPTYWFPIIIQDPRTCKITCPKHRFPIPYSFQFLKTPSSSPITDPKHQLFYKCCGKHSPWAIFVIITVIFSFSSVSVQVHYYAEMVSKNTICIITSLNIFQFNNFPVVIIFSAILNGRKCDGYLWSQNPKLPDYFKSLK